MQMRNVSFSVGTLFLGIGGIANATPIEIPGLVYHLDAGASSSITQSGGAVSSWSDVNGNGQTFTQGTPVKQPTLIAGNAAGNIGGLPVIRFDGDLTGNSAGVAPNADELINTSPTTVQTIIVVDRTLQYRGLDGIWGENNGDTGVRRTSNTDWQHPGNSNDLSNGGAIYVNGTPSTASPLNTAEVLTAVRGEVVGVGAHGATATFSATSIGDYFQVGANTPRSWNGDIAEMAVFNRALTPTEQQSIEQYLGQKYGIAVAPEPASFAIIAGGFSLLALSRRRRLAVR